MEGRASWECDIFGVGLGWLKRRLVLLGGGRRAGVGGATFCDGCVAFSVLRLAAEGWRANSYCDADRRFRQGRKWGDFRARRGAAEVAADPKAAGAIGNRVAGNVSNTL